MDGATRPLAGGCLRDKRAPVEAAIETARRESVAYVLEAHQARLHGRDFSIMVRSQLWSRVILVVRMRSRIWAMLAAVKLREHYSLYVASVEGVPQDPLVR